MQNDTNVLQLEIRNNDELEDETEEASEEKLDDGVQVTIDLYDDESDHQCIGRSIGICHDRPSASSSWDLNNSCSFILLQ